MRARLVAIIAFFAIIAAPAMQMATRFPRVGPVDENRQERGVDQLAAFNKGEPGRVVARLAEHVVAE